MLTALEDQAKAERAAAERVAAAEKPPPPPPTAPEPPSRAGSRATFARNALAAGDKVHALKLAGSGQVSASGMWCEATVLAVGASGNLHVHFFGWKAEIHDEWIKAEVKGSRLREFKGSLKDRIRFVPESERDEADEESVVLLVERPGVTDYMRVLGDDSRWRLVEIIDECEESAGQRDVLAREVLPPGANQQAWEEWVPCSESHRFRCTCGDGHLLTRLESGPAFRCPGTYGGQQCSGCPGELSESDPRAICPICRSRGHSVCLACANAQGHNYPRRQEATEKAARRETIETGRMRAPLAANGSNDAAAAQPHTALLPPPPTPQQQQGLQRLEQLASGHSDLQRIKAKLLESLPDARGVVIYAVNHEPARARMDLALQLRPALQGSIQELFHSPGGWTSQTDPLDVIGSDFGFDHTFASTGTYGDGAFCFAAHAIYCDRLLPCRTSSVHKDGYECGLPSVGDDILLHGEDAPQHIYEVVSVGVGGDPSLCRLRQLQWTKGEKGAGQETTWHLGDGSGDTTAWSSADERYLLVTDVALGKCKDYGKEEPNIKAGEVPREPEGFHSTSGTEQDLASSRIGIPQLVYRFKTDDHKHDYAPLVRDGAKYGKQYAVWRSEQTCVTFLVRYQRRRIRSAAEAEAIGSGRRDGGAIGDGGVGDGGEGGGGDGGGRAAATRGKGKGKGKAPADDADRRAASEPPLFSMGLIADVQYANLPNGTNHDGNHRRYYRGSLAALERAVEYWRAQRPPLACVAQLGDLIDGKNKDSNESAAALEATIGQLKRAQCPLVSVVGNHDLTNFSRATLRERTGTFSFADGWFSSRSLGKGWRTIVLDSYQESVVGWPEDDPRHREAVRLLQTHNPRCLESGGDWLKGLKGMQRRFVPFNGGFGSQQLGWLRNELRKAAEASERVLLLSHAALSPQACDGTTMAWDYKEALGVIRASGVVAAVLCGHDHKGGYHLDGSVHHLTLSSPLNELESEAFGTFHAFRDRIEIRGPNLRHLLPYEKIDGRSQADPERLTLGLKPCACGPARVFLLRHGESKSNAAGDHSLRNPRLTPLGCAQARAWAGKLGTHGIQCVLVSPLHRAIETAALTLAGLEDSVSIDVCRHARELFWHNGENALGGAEEARALLRQLNVSGAAWRSMGGMGSIDCAFNGDSSEQEHASIAALQAVLRGRTEQTILIVCHWGVIEKLCGEKVNNGVLVECERSRVSGQLRVLSRREAALTGESAHSAMSHSAAQVALLAE